MRFYALATALMCFAALGGAGEFDEVYRQGIAVIREGRMEEALAIFRKALAVAENDSQKTDAILQISLSMPVDRENEALSQLSDHQQQIGRLPPAMEAKLALRIGVLQARLKQHGEAVKTLSYALGLGTLSPRDRNLAYDMLSGALPHEKKYEESLKILSQWEDLDGISANDYARLLTRRAGVFGVLKRFDEAYETGTTAADAEGVSPTNRALAWQMLAHIALANEKNPQKAKTFSEKSRDANNGKAGFNQKLHEQILAPCNKGGT